MKVAVLDTNENLATDLCAPKIRQYKGDGLVMFYLTDKRTAMRTSDLQFFIIQPITQTYKNKVLNARAAIESGGCKNIDTLLEILEHKAIWIRSKREWLLWGCEEDV